MLNHLFPAQVFHLCIITVSLTAFTAYHTVLRNTSFFAIINFTIRYIFSDTREVTKMSFDNIQNTPMSKAQIAEYLQRIEARWPDGTPAGAAHFPHPVRKSRYHGGQTDLTRPQRPFPQDHHLPPRRCLLRTEHALQLAAGVARIRRHELQRAHHRIDGAGPDAQPPDNRRPYAKRHFSERRGFQFRSSQDTAATRG